MIKFYKGDFFGGVTAGVVALPLALAFGVQSGLGAIAGLYGAIAIGILASLFGGTNTQISGPTGPMTVVSALVIASAIKLTGSLEQGMGMIIVTFFLAGAFQIVFGVTQLGKYIRYIPYPVISGFMSGIGVIIIIFQIFPLLGYSAPTRIIMVFMNILEPLFNPNWLSVCYTVATIILIYTLPKLTKAIPSALLALIIVTIVSVIVTKKVTTIGHIPHGLPALKLKELMTFHLWEVPDIVFPALMLAALGAIDSLLTSIVADNLTRTRHSSNKELIGQGIGNMAAAMIGGLPGAGATMRTVVNINAGGKTRISGIIHGVVLLLIVLGLGTFAEKIPLPVLSGILITVGIGIIDYKGLKHIFHVPRTDAVVMIIVLLLTVFVNLLQAVAVGLILASLLFMKRMGDIAEENTKFETLQDYSKEIPWADEASLSGELAKQVYIKHLYGPLFFGFTSQFQALVLTIPDVKYVVIRMDKVPYIDQSGLYAIEEAVLYLESRGIDVLFSGIQSQPKDMLKGILIIPNLVAESEVFDDIASCFDWLRHKLVKSV